MAMGGTVVVAAGAVAVARGVAVMVVIIMIAVMIIIMISSKPWFGSCSELDYFISSQFT
jgi:hypothetical protein